jgi:hypothetical protein
VAGVAQAFEQRVERRLVVVAYAIRVGVKGCELQVGLLDGADRLDAVEPVPPG